MVLYKEIGRIDNDYFYNTDNSKFGNNFLRFYGSGKFSVFNRVGYDSKNHKLLSNYKISREDFNPEKSQMGVIYDVEKIIYTRHLIINQCKADISNAILTIKGDSLYLKSVGHPHMGTRVYMKYNINNTFLEGWKPDW
ncbi:MAG: hypothetical protein GKR88_02805 [Flavobacteriaceae bacterium]|nr:MAG: hypothetical protein GKR88_02805 [Flavobacteriaceae bacterium]